MTSCEVSVPRRDQEVARLIERYRSSLAAFCARFHDDPYEREELAQLVMIRVWHGFEGFDGRSAFTTWLFQIVRNTAISEYERRARRPAPVGMVDDDAQPVGRARVAAVEDTVVLRDTVSRALDTLDERFRHTVELVDGWGCSPTEVARITGVAEATVRTRLFRGRRTMRAEMGSAA